MFPAAGGPPLRYSDIGIYAVFWVYLLWDPWGSISSRLHPTGDSLTMSAAAFSVLLSAVHYQRRWPLHAAAFIPFISMTLAYLTVAAVMDQLKYGYTEVFVISLFYPAGAAMVYCPAIAMLVLAVVVSGRRR